MPEQPTWDILVCSIWHRSEMLAELLDRLEHQCKDRPDVGVRVMRDNLQTGYGEKCQALLDSSSADYVCFLDDDDGISGRYVASIRKALRQRPDYVGFNVRYTEDGKPQPPVVHSLAFYGWTNTDELLSRDIVHFNPIRRELALCSRWEGGNGADWNWAAGLRALHIVKTQVFIPQHLYHYRSSSTDTFTTDRRPLRRDPAPALRRSFPKVEWL